MTQAFSTVAEFADILRDLPGIDTEARAQAIARDRQLTKPPGSLGRLEELAVWYAGWRRDPRPQLTRPQIVIFAGNHGVTARGVSAFPSEVTAQMVANFEHGGAAINQLARSVDARMDVHALSLDRPTADFTEGPAMDEDGLLAALQGGLGGGRS